MITIPKIETERLILDPISVKYCNDKYLGWLNNEEIYQYLDSGGNYTQNDLFDYLTLNTKVPILFWAIIVKESNKHIGNIKIDPINQRNKIGEYGILIGDQEYWGKGYSKEASIAVINYCFKQIGLRKICLGVIKDNKPAVKLYENLGFITEGISHMHGIYGGKYCDALRMAIFNNENPDVIKYFKK